MSYHLKDLIVDITTPEKAELMFDTLDLLDTVNYIDHIKPLEDILMAVDMYSYNDTLNMIEATLIVSLVECSKEYGLYIDDSNDTLFSLKNVHSIVGALVDIINDDTKNLVNKFVEEKDPKTRFIYLIQDLTELDFNELSELINDIDDSLLEGITDNEPKEIINEKILEKNRYRLDKYPKLKPIVEKDIFIKQVGLGYDFYNVFFIFLDDLKNEIELDKLASKYVALIMLSNIKEEDFENTIHSTVGYIEESEEPTLAITSLKKLKEYMTNV